MHVELTKEEFEFLRLHLEGILYQMNTNSIKDGDPLSDSMMYPTKCTIGRIVNSLNMAVEDNED